jgi:hypothetical protein
MIVLDEQLQSRTVRRALTAWYQGKISAVADLRPRTTIKDDAIPVLLRTVRDPTFLTINVTDFWRKVAPEKHYCVICFPLAQPQAVQVSELLRCCLLLAPFRSKRRRMGKIVRVSESVIQFYDTASWAVQEILWPAS